MFMFFMIFVCLSAFCADPNLREIVDTIEIAVRATCVQGESGTASQSIEEDDDKSSTERKVQENFGQHEWSAELHRLKYVEYERQMREKEKANQEALLQKRQRIERSEEEAQRQREAELEEEAQRQREADKAKNQPMSACSVM